MSTDGTKKRDAPRRKKSQVRPGKHAGIYFAEPGEHETVSRAADATGQSMNEFIVRDAVKRAERVLARQSKPKAKAA